MPGDAAGRRRRGNAAKSIEFGGVNRSAEKDGSAGRGKPIGPGDIAEADPDTSPTRDIEFGL
jgi:hypothetical protein